MKPTVLITNDDGIDAFGINLLAEVVSIWADVIIVAPDRERSGCGNSITLNHYLEVDHRTPNSYAISGTPADCIMLALKTLLSKTPDLVISGINIGPNMGFDIYCSGTVAGARMACFFKIPSIAVSLVPNGPANFNIAANYTSSLAQNVLKDRLPDGMFLNVNVPQKLKKNKHVAHETVLGQRIYQDKLDCFEKDGKKYYSIVGGQIGHEDIDNSDCNTVDRGIISVTPLGLNSIYSESLPSLKKLITI